VILSTDLTSCKPFREEKAEKNGQGRRLRGALGGKPLILKEEVRKKYKIRLRMQRSRHAPPCINDA
jgi:hypothetical protein